MPAATNSAGNLAKLFGFIGKNSLKNAPRQVATHAVMGMGAVGLRNAVQGRDITDGMLDGAALGAAGGVAWKTYQNAGRAGRVAGAMRKMESATTLSAKVAPGRVLAREAEAMGLRSRVRPARLTGGATTGAAVQQGGTPVAAAAATANRGATLSANQAVQSNQLFSSGPVAQHVARQKASAAAMQNAPRRTGLVHDLVAGRAAGGDAAASSALAKADAMNRMSARPLAGMSPNPSMRNKGFAGLMSKSTPSVATPTMKGSPAPIATGRLAMRNGLAPVPSWS